MFHAVAFQNNSKMFFHSWPGIKFVRKAITYKGSPDCKKAFDW